MWRVAVVGSKGGIGKTTLTVGIGAALARRGRRVLVVDLDAQGSATAALGVTPGRHTIGTALPAGLPLTTACVEARERLSLIPADRSVGELEPWLLMDRARWTALRDALVPFGRIFDVVLLDTSPGFSVLNLAAYLAAHGLVVPSTPDGLALRGVVAVEENLDRLRADGFPAPTVALACVTMADRRHGRTALAENALALKYGTRCGPALRVCSALSVALANGATIYEHAPKSTAAEDLDALATHLEAGLLAIGTATPTDPERRGTAPDATATDTDMGGGEDGTDSSIARQ